MPPAVVSWFVAVALPGWSRPRSTLGRMAEWCMRFTPRVHVEEADPAIASGAPLVLLDASGCLRVNGGAGRLARRVGRGLARRGIAHAIGSAPSGGEAVVRATAAALGRTDGGGAGCSAPDLDSLPVEALRLAEPACEALREVNIRRIGELRAISRAALADRVAAYSGGGGGGGGAGAGAGGHHPTLDVSGARARSGHDVGALPARFPRACTSLPLPLP